jgi:hypothetical protein
LVFRDGIHLQKKPAARKGKEIAANNWLERLPPSERRPLPLALLNIFLTFIQFDNKFAAPQFNQPRLCGCSGKLPSPELER